MTANALKLSLEIEAKVAEAKAALETVIAKVKESGQAAVAADKEAIGAAKQRIGLTKEKAQAEDEFAVVGVRSQKAIREEMTRVLEALRKLKTDSKTSGNDFARAFDAGKAKLAELKREMQGVTQEERDMATIGVRSNREIKAEIDRVSAALDRLKKSGATAWSTDMARASDAAKAKLATLRQEMAGTGSQAGTLERQSGSLGAAWGKLGAIWLTFQGLLAAGGLIGMIEDMQRLEARLETTEGSAGRAAVAMEAIKKIAQDTGTPINKVADAYVRFSGAIQRVGGSQQQSIKFTDALTKALKNSGASAETAGIVMMQLGQAFDSGKLSGDEFKSVAENGGKVLTYLADALGVTRGELRKMSEDGELTVDKLLKLTDAAEKIDRDFGKLPRTVGDAVTRIANAFVVTAAKSETLRVILGGLAVVLEFVAKNLGKVLATGVVVTLASWIIAAGGVTAAFTGMAAAITRVSGALALLAKNPWVIGITVALTAIIWLWDELVGAAEKFSGVSFGSVNDELNDMETHLNEIASKVGPALEKVKKAIEANRKAAEESGKAISDAYAIMTSQIGTEAAEQVRQIQGRYNEEKRLIGETKSASDARYLAEAQALTASVQQQLQILGEATTRKLGLLDEEYRVKKEIAARMVDTDRERVLAMQNLDNELLGKKRAVLSDMLADYRSHIDALNTEAQRNLEAMRTIEDQKRQLSMSTEEKIRAMRQSAMGEYQAYQDRIKQIDELTSKARAALAAGDSKLAEEYAKKAIDATGQIAKSVSQDGKEIISQQQAVGLAIGKITEAEQIAQQAMDARKTAHGQAAQAAQTEAQTVSMSMDQIATKLGEINTQLSQGAQFTITTNVDQVMLDLQKLDDLIQQREVLLSIQSNVGELQDKVADLKNELEKGTKSDHEIADNAAHVQNELNALDGQVTNSTHIIHVERVEGDAAGGWAGESVRYLASGGAAWKRITGRVFGPGTTTSDSIRAMLSREEFVVRAKATNVVSRMFPGFMEAFNAISSPADLAKLLGSVANSFAAPQVLHLAGGGPATIPAMSGMPGNAETMTVNWQLNGKEYPVRVMRADKPMLHGMLDELDRAKRLAGR